jgi:hypothetical protein
VELTSSCADACGVTVPTPTCACVEVAATNSNKLIRIDLNDKFIFFI